MVGSKNKIGFMRFRMLGVFCLFSVFGWGFSKAGCVLMLCWVYRRFYKGFIEEMKKLIVLSVCVWIILT